MGFLAFLEQLRAPWLDQVFLWITLLGEQAAAVAVLLVLLWCVDKRRGWRLILTLLVSTALSQFFKAAFRIPRPFLRDPSLHPVPQAVPAATGYSFPSGHTQSAGVLYGALVLESRRRPLRLLGAALLALVAFSRMYLGVHTPADVLFSLIMSLALLTGLRALSCRLSGKSAFLFWLAAALGGVLLAAGLAFFETDQELVAHSLSNLRSLFGVLLGLAAAYELDTRWVRYETAAPLPVQLAKLLLGLLTTGGLFLGLRALGLTHGWWSIPGYGLTVCYALGVYPLSFRFWPGAGDKREKVCYTDK